MTDLAIKKLQAELKTANTDKYGNIMKNDVCKALIGFCKQDAEFAQAVYQGGSFEDCMKTVAKNCGTGISDLEAYRRAVQFYFPGADIKFHMTVNLCASVEEPEKTVEKQDPMLLDLTDFL